MNPVSNASTTRIASGTGTTRKMLPSPSRPNELGRFTTGIPSVMTSVTPRAKRLGESPARNRVSDYQEGLGD